MNGAGDALAVWFQSDTGPNSIWGNRYGWGTGWGTATTLEMGSSEAMLPQVALDAQGNALAAWEQSDGSRLSIWASRYQPESGWGTPALLETDNAGNADGPAVVSNGVGDALAVWPQSDGTRYNIWANRYEPGTGWGTATLLETENAGDAFFPRVAVDAPGNGLAVWSQSDGTRYNIWGNRYVAKSGWGTATLIEADNAGDANSPRVAIDGMGNGFAVWWQSDGTRYNILANRYVTGIGWGTATTIEDSDTGDAISPDVAVDDTGNGLAVWQQSDGTRNSIWANRFVPGVGWGTAIRIDTDPGDARDPRIAMDAEGRAIAVWSQSDGTRYNVWAATFQ